METHQQRSHFVTNGLLQSSEVLMKWINWLTFQKPCGPTFPVNQTGNPKVGQVYSPVFSVLGFRRLMSQCLKQIKLRTSNIRPNTRARNGKRIGDTDT
jgi:hypothetical protein